MTIKIEDGIDDLTAITLVKQVIEQGRISANGNSYCYLTLFGDICVETRQYRKSPCFRVYKKMSYDTTRKDTEESRGIWAARSSVPRRRKVRT